MVSKSKRAAALVLTAVLAAASLAGCGGTTTVTSGGTQTSGGTTSSASTESNAGSGAGDAVDIDSEETIKTIKDAMAKEAEATGGKISMKLWCSGDDLKFEKKLIEEFKEKYKDDRFEIKIQASGAIGEDAAGGKIVESPQDGADVFNFADDQLSTLVEAKAIAKVANLFQNNVVKNNSEDAVTVCKINDTAYAFPKTSDNGYFMYYDKRVFKDEKSVENMDDMIKTANEAGKSVYLNLSNGWYNTGFFFTAGCTVEYKDGVQTADYANEKGLAAAKAMCHLAENIDKGFVGTAGSAGDNAAVQQGFANNQYAAAIIGTWMGPAIKKSIGEENVGAAKLPTVLMDGEQKQLHSFGGYKVVGVNAFTKYPTTAQTLAYFLTTGESQLKRYACRGLIPTNNEALQTKETVKNILDDTDVQVDIQSDPALKAIDAQRQYAHPQGSSVGGKYWASNIGGFGSEIVTAKGKISDADLEKKLKDLVDQMKG